MTAATVAGAGAEARARRRAPLGAHQRHQRESERAPSHSTVR